MFGLEGFGAEIEFLAILKGVVDRYGTDISPNQMRSAGRWFSQYIEDYAKAVEDLS